MKKLKVYWQDMTKWSIKLSILFSCKIIIQMILMTNTYQLNVILMIMCYVVLLVRSVFNGKERSYTQIVLE